MKKEVKFSERIGMWVMKVAGQGREVYGYYTNEALARTALEINAALVKAGKPLSANP